MPFVGLQTYHMIVCFFLKWGVLDFEFIFSWSNFPQESHLYFSGCQTTLHGAVLHLLQPGVIIFIFHKCIGPGLRENRVIPIPFDSRLKLLIFHRTFFFLLPPWMESCHILRPKQKATLAYSMSARNRNLVCCIYFCILSK